MLHHAEKYYSELYVEYVDFPHQILVKKDLFSAVVYTFSDILSTPAEKDA